MKLPPTKRFRQILKIINLPSRIFGRGLTSLVVVSFVFVIIIAALASYMNHRNMIQDVEDENLAVGRGHALMGARYISDHQETFLNRLNALAAGPSFVRAVTKGDTKQLAALLQAMSVEHFELDAILLVDTKGRRLLSLPEGNRAPTIDIQHADWFTHVKMTSFHYISDVSPGWFTAEEKGIVLASPVHDPQKGLVGVLAVFQRMDLWENFFFLMTSTPGLGFWLVDRSGEMIAGWGGPEKWYRHFVDRRQYLDEIVKKLRARRMAKATSMIINHPVTGKAYFLSAALIPSLGWTLFISRDYDDVMATRNAMFSSQKVFMGLLGFSLMLLGFLMYSRNRLQQQALARVDEEARKLEALVRERTRDLSRSRERYRGLVQGMPDVVFEINTSGKVAFVCDAIERVLGYEPDEIVGRFWRDLVVPDDQDIYDVLSQSTEQGKDEKIMALRHVAKNGEIRWLSIHSRTYYEPQARSVVRLAVARNVTPEILAEQRIRELSRRLLTTQEAERKRLALDLHDEMGQLLSALKFRMEDMVQEAGDMPDAWWGQMGELVDLTQHTMDRSRDLAYSLWPALLDRFGLGPAIEDMCETMAVESKTEIRTELGHWNDSAISPEAKITMFRFVQECLTNALRHSGASSVQVTFSIADGLLLGRVSDDGSGFDEKTIFRQGQQGRHLGLVGMAERLKFVGGKLEVKSNGQGSTLEAFVPFNEDGHQPLDQGA